MAQTVELVDVSYRYGGALAIRDVSVVLPVGVTALLGPNGAGKSTLLQVLATLRRPSKGKILVDGNEVGWVDNSALRRQIGFLPQRYTLMPTQTVEQNVAVAAWIHGVAARDSAQAALVSLERVDMVHLANSRVGTLSGGQRQRLGIACATAHEPTLVILDEPTVGLDPAQRRNVSELISALGKNYALVVSTHIVDDLARFADRVLVLNSGALVFNSSLIAFEALASGTGNSRSERLEMAYESVLRSAI